MIMLELFLSPHCISAPSVIEVAKEAVRRVPGVKLVIRSDLEDSDRARMLGIFIYPAFVLGGEVLGVGEPGLEQFIQALKRKVNRKKRNRGGKLLKQSKQGGLT